MLDCDAVFVIVLSLKRWSDYLRTLVFCRVIAGEKHERKSKISFPPFCGQMMQHRTRIKICGLTNLADVNTVVASGADALGFVFYPPSPRYVTAERAAELVRLLPPFVSAVGLFVNAEPADLAATLATVPLHILQFHGDEDEAYCRRFQRPYLKAARVMANGEVAGSAALKTAKDGGAGLAGMDLLQYAASFPSAQAIILDAFVEGYGGGGKTFDWTLIPAGLSLPLVLSGGLNAENVGPAIHKIKPLAVDISSGVEAAKGIKDAAKMAAFVAAVQAADAGN